MHFAIGTESVEKSMHEVEAMINEGFRHVHNEWIIAMRRESKPCFPALVLDALCKIGALLQWPFEPSVEHLIAVAEERFQGFMQFGGEMHRKAHGFGQLLYPGDELFSLPSRLGVVQEVAIPEFVGLCHSRARVTRRNFVHSKVLLPDSLEGLGKN